MRIGKAVKGFLSFCILLILVFIMLYSGLRIWESTVLHSEEPAAETIPTKTITRNGIDYYPRQDVTVMLVIGTDQSGPVKSSNYYRNEASADSVVLLLFDETNYNCTVLYLNRDTMLEMDTLGVRGEYAGPAYGQLALAHTYGTGLEDSCVNVKNTLMKFIHGLTIDYYVSVNMDAVPILNDAVGGVTVNVTEDFSKVDRTIKMGEQTLMGDQVLSYVRTRKNVSDQKNVTRMERHKEYIYGFLNKLREKELEDASFILNVYEQVAPYLVSDCPISTLSGMMERYADFDIKEIVSPEGENVLGDEHYEFYVDEEKLDELIVRLFYAPK